MYGFATTSLRGFLTKRHTRLGNPLHFTRHLCLSIPTSSGDELEVGASQTLTFASGPSRKALASNRMAPMVPPHNSFDPYQ